MFSVTVCAGVIGASRAEAQARPEVIQGRVTTVDGKPVVGARALVTRGPDRALFQALSDEAGVYRVSIDSGTGDYLVYIAAPQPLILQPFRRRVTRQAPADTLFVVDAVLKAPDAVQQLSTVRVQARKPTPSRSDDLRTGPGGSESPAAGGAAALLPDQLGDLNALGATIAGASPTANGISVFGLPSSQNSVTLNGLAFPGATLPRDAMTRVQLVTGAYDPARGWFGGAETRVALSQDFLFSSLTTSTSLDAPALQGESALSARSGQNFTSITQGMGATGFLASGTLTYNASAQLSRRSSDIATLADLDQGILQHAGVARDSAARLLQIAAATGVPIGAPRAPSAIDRTGASLLVGISTLALDRNTFRPRRNVGGLTVYASRDETEGAGLHALTTRGAAAHTTSDVGAIQGELSSYLTSGLLLETRSALSVSNQHSAPYLALPSAGVLVGSTFADAPGGLAMLNLGGSPLGASQNRAVTWESQGDARFYLHAAHRVHVSADLRYDAVSRQSGLNESGAFAFNSLADLAANHPMAFTRTLNAPRREGSVWNSFVSLGDYWRVVPSFELLYGARVEGNVFADHPAYNASVDAAFGSRTDRVPNTLHVSPRAGFTWTYNASAPGGGVVRNDHGVFELPFIGVLRGGIGEFRSLMSPNLIADASASTGLPGGLRQVACAGSAVPTPDWNAYLSSPGALPEDCVVGSGSTAVRDGAPPVQLLARDFTAARSWRANLSWTSYHDALVWTVEGAYSLNVNQPGRVDLNFGDAPVAQLAGEGGRPMFVPLSSIVPASGVVPGQEARRSQDFGAVMQARSNLRSAVSQVTVTLVPDLTRFARSRFFASLAYTVAHARAQQGGFDGSTFGSPSGLTWSQGQFTPRHAFLLQASLNTHYLSVGLFGRVASGLSFTPMVGSDINGDGLPNDRAFVFDPAGAIDPSAAAAMRSLLAGGARNVRSCLQRQLAQPASANSCEGPWTASLNARVHLNTGASAGWARRVNASLYFANPLAGIDQLLHGSNLRGWGNQAVPDQTLLRVTGFDPTTERFRYSVNPRFGDTRPGSNPFSAPFRVTLDIRLDLGRPRDLQILDRSLQPGRGGYGGTRRTAAQISQFYARTLPRPFAAVLALTDSLLLTPNQVRAVMAGQSRYDARADSVVAGFSAWLAALPDRYDAAEALRRQNELLNTILNVGRDEVQATLKPVLNPIQVKLLPWPVDMMFHASSPLTLRDIRR